MSKKKRISKKEAFKELTILVNKFKKEFPNLISSYITKEYYEKHSKLPRNQVLSLFGGSFTEFKNQHKKINKVDDNKIELEKKLKILDEENKKLKKQKDELLKSAINNETILNIYEKNINKISKLKINNVIINKKSSKHAILNLGDWHIGETVNLEEVNGINEYNKDIFIKRADKVFNSFVGYCKNIDIKECTLNFLGDLLTGNIHQELEATNEINVVDSMFFLQNYLINKLTWLSNHFNKIKINFLSGNHGRITSCTNTKPFYKKKAILNWEYIVAKQIKIMLEHNKTNKIKINIPHSPFMLDNVNGNIFLLQHGDSAANASNSFAGLPYYGLASSSAKLYGALNIAESILFHNIILGHYHITASIPLFNGGKMWINGSLIGATEFSLIKIKMVSTIQQLMLIIDKNGNIDGEININGR